MGLAERNSARYNAGRWAERDYELARLTMLAKHLEDVRQHDMKMLEYLRKKINRDDANYYGFRFELAVTASLLRRGVPFKRAESPDFILQWEGHEIAIECTSRHFSGVRADNLAMKLESAIVEKSKKGYAKPDTALFAEVTNIYHYGVLHTDKTILSPELKTFTKNSLQSSRFGSIVWFVFLLNRDLNRFELNYNRVDSKLIRPPLRGFLDAFYPFGKHDVHDYVIPSIG
jgi:hypothetical protein